jgi:hypothetical protein
VEIAGPDSAMVRRRVMLRIVIGVVVLATLPFHGELLLVYAVAYPVKTHVDSLGAALFDGIFGYTLGGEVVGGDGGWWLGPG